MWFHEDQNVLETELSEELDVKQKINLLDLGLYDLCEILDKFKIFQSIVHPSQTREHPESSWIITLNPRDFSV